MTLVKICGLMRAEDADAVNAAGPDFAGFILSQGFRRSISAERAAAISARLNSSITPVGVFVDETEEYIAPFVEQKTIRAVQLHGSEDESLVRALKERFPDTLVIKAFKVKGADDVAAANASGADLVLLDNGQGTGERFDWSVLDSAARPYILAGGLGPGNVSAAIEQLHPYAVDMSSGVETNGQKDPQKIMEAVKGVQRD